MHRFTVKSSARHLVFQINSVLYPVPYTMSMTLIEVILGRDEDEMLGLH